MTRDVEITVEAGRDVSVSADDVKGDKITNQPDSDKQLRSPTPKLDPVGNPDSSPVSPTDVVNTAVEVGRWTAAIAKVISIAKGLVSFFKG